MDNKIKTGVVDDVAELKDVFLDIIRHVDKSKFSHAEITCEKLVKDGTSIEGLRLVLGSPTSAPVSQAAPPRSASVSATEADTSAASAPEEVKGNVIKSPIVGTFYSSSAPDSAPFVHVGSSVKKGDVVCIIEAMKTMNEVESEFDGVVVEVLVDNGQMVEYGMPVMVIG